ncbi:MAG TPA: hypothetical protein ENK57_13805 [Polyangiaceae bacterium]|nr:hypothetical protein [Polyangiaceae bacterium]
MTLARASRGLTALAAAAVLTVASGCSSDVVFGDGDGGAGAAEGGAGPVSGVTSGSGGSSSTTSGAGGAPTGTGGSVGSTSGAGGAPTGSGSGPGGFATSTSGAGGAPTGFPTGSGGFGGFPTGGGGSCSSCGDKLFNGVPDPLCPWSEPLFDAVVQCACVTQCPMECFDACNGMGGDPPCEDCLLTQCVAEIDACANDL